MESSHIFLNAMTYVAFIILSGLSLLICLILFIIRLSQDHKQKWNWLIASVLSVFALLFSVYLFTRKVVITVKEIGKNVEQKLEESVQELQKHDTSYHYAKILSNDMIKKLKEFEHINAHHKAPDEFYVYFGYIDYYRMPLTFPYSLHCNDVLETAELFDERNVSAFNSNDNGEIQTGIAGVKKFAFDNSAFVGLTKLESGKESYIIYSFNDSKQKSFPTLKEALKAARNEFNYRGYDTLISINNYYSLFN